jgi:hypothetical protein
MSRNKEYIKEKFVTIQYLHSYEQKGDLNVGYFI